MNHNCLGASMITFDGVSKDFRTHFWAKPFRALDKVSFQIRHGEVVGFLGANGAGKTTSMKILMGFIRPAEGEVLFDPILGQNRNEVLSKIGFLPERPYFYPHLTGREFLHFMGGLNKLKRNVLEARIKEWAARLGIEFALSRRVRDYSKGMLQRLGLISALLHDPEILILDEPLSGLDPLGRKELKDLLLELCHRGKTIFFSSHIVPDVEEICRKVIFLEKGRVVYQGEIDTLVEQNLAHKTIVRAVIRDRDIRTPHKILDAHIETGVKTIEVEASRKNDCLRELVAQNIEILSANPLRPSLEEIFYKIKGNV
jgi:ABC-2 type transport system ATP-binding protein